MSKDVRIPRSLACRISDRWTVYRILRVPSWLVSNPWMAVAPGKGYGQRCATQAEAFAYAEARAGVVMPVEQEVCSLSALEEKAYSRTIVETIEGVLVTTENMDTRSAGATP